MSRMLVYDWKAILKRSALNISLGAALILGYSGIRLAGSLSDRYAGWRENSRSIGEIETLIEEKDYGPAQELLVRYDKGDNITDADAVILQERLTSEKEDYERIERKIDFETTLHELRRQDPNQAYAFLSEMESSGLYQRSQIKTFETEIFLSTEDGRYEDSISRTDAKDRLINLRDYLRRYPDGKYTEEVEADIVMTRARIVQESLGDHEEASKELSRLNSALEEYDVDPNALDFATLGQLADSYRDSLISRPGRKGVYEPGKYVRTTEDSNDTFAGILIRSQGSYGEVLVEDKGLELKKVKMTDLVMMPFTEAEHKALLQEAYRLENILEVYGNAMD